MITALLLLALHATPPTPATAARALVTVDGGAGLFAHAAARPDATQMFPTLLLRAGARTVDGGGFAWGGAARAGATWPRDDGTSDVGSALGDLWLEGQGDVGWRLGRDALSITPLLWGSVFGGARWAALRAFKDGALRPSPIFGARAGVGALLAVGAFTLRWELGAGLRERGLETTTALMGGAAF